MDMGKIIKLTKIQRSFLARISRKTTLPQRLVQRSKIILALDEGNSLRNTAKKLAVDKKTVQKWADRWRNSLTKLLKAESADELKPNEYFDMITQVFVDSLRSGTPPTFTAEQVTQIVAIACEVIDDSDRPFSRWTHREIANECIKRNIADSISPASIGRFLKRSSDKTT